jgi:DNA N-6-adenine-methyltransferase (Dam)
MSHLQCVKGLYRVRIVVPPVLRPIIGRESLVKALGTGNRAKASRLAEPYIAEFKARLRRAANTEQYDYNANWDDVDLAIMGKQYHNNVKPRRRTDTLSDSPEWFTPKIVFQKMAVEFDMDVASPGSSFVPWIPVKRHLTKAEDGLTTPWEGFTWCNPPYGLRKGMQKWIDRFVDHRNGVILLPGYTYTQWWQEFVQQTDCVLFVLSKLQFISPVSRNGKNCTLANVMAAIGDQGTTALRNAAANGLGQLFIRRSFGNAVPETGRKRSSSASIY